MIFILNGRQMDVAAQPDETLLWVLREKLKLTGTKYGVTTIEGLSPDGGHPVQKAWLAEQVLQCGYCQPGQIMQAAALLAKTPKPSRAQIIQAMNGNLCRCGTYGRIVRAVERAARGEA